MGWRDTRTRKIWAGREGGREGGRDTHVIQVQQIFILGDKYYKNYNFEDRRRIKAGSQRGTCIYAYLQSLLSLVQEVSVFTAEG